MGTVVTEVRATMATESMRTPPSSRLPVGTIQATLPSSRSSQEAMVSPLSKGTASLSSSSPSRPSLSHNKATVSRSSTTRLRMDSRPAVRRGMGSLSSSSTLSRVAMAVVVRHTVPLPMAELRRTR